MKKLLLTGFYAIMTAMMLTLTSCEDEYVASTLEGTWEGNMYVEYEWYGQYYKTSRSEVCFNLDPFRFKRGDGYWVDYFPGRTPWSTTYYANHIRWTVENGIINIYFIEDDCLLSIRNYRINDSYFAGEVYGSDGSWREFRLRHTSSPNWNDYTWGYDYYDYSYNGYYPYYAKTRSDSSDAQPVCPEKPKRVIK